MGIEFRDWLFSRKGFTALVAVVTLATIVSFLFWAYTNAAYDPRSTGDTDLSKLLERIPTLHWMTVTLLICAIRRAGGLFHCGLHNSCSCK
jgi:hypothetical protein